MRSQNYVRDETRCGGGGPKVSLATVSRKIPVGSQQTPSGVGRVVDVKRVPGGKKSCGPFCYLRVAEAGRRLEDDSGVGHRGGGCRGCRDRAARAAAMVYVRARVCALNALGEREGRTITIHKVSSTFASI
jgi:hypothetical protein